VPHESPARSAPERLDVAVDASVMWRGDKPVAAVVAWVFASDPEHLDCENGSGDLTGSLVLPAGVGVLAAELTAIAVAIEQALRLHPLPERLRVLSDSRAALDTLRRARTQGRKARDAEEDALKRVTDATRAAENGRMRIELAHVRGHGGHPLNEAAHRLATDAARQAASQQVASQPAASQRASPRRTGASPGC